MRSAVFAIVFVLISGPGSENTTTQWTTGDHLEEEARVHRDVVKNIVMCLDQKGFPMEKEILYGGQVVNWVLTNRSDDCCQVKTSFRAFASRESMKKFMTGISAASVQHGELNVAMLAPWTIRMLQDCEACSTSFEKELLSAFMGCDGRETNGARAR